MSEKYLGKYNIVITAPLKIHDGRIDLFERDGIICGELEIPEGKSEFSNVVFIDNQFTITYDSNIPMPTTQTLSAILNDEEISGTIEVSIGDSFTAKMKFSGKKSKFNK